MLIFSKVIFFASYKKICTLEIEMKIKIQFNYTLKYKRKRKNKKQGKISGKLLEKKNQGRKNGKEKLQIKISGKILEKKSEQEKWKKIRKNYNRNNFWRFMKKQQYTLCLVRR